MIALTLGMIIAAGGYTVFCYGAELFQGEAVTLGSASGFAKPPTPTNSKGSSGIAGTLAPYLAPLLFFV